MIEYPSASERRITVRLLAYWEKLRAGRDMPVEDDINPDDIADLWGSCFLVHTQDIGKPDYQYSYLGPTIGATYRGGLSEGDSNGLISPHAGKLAACYARVISTRKPLVDDGEFRNQHNDVVKYRQCLLPLGGGGEVQAIFGGMRCKIFRSQ